MNLDYRLLLKLGAASAFSYYFLYFLKELAQSIKDTEEVRGKQVHDLMEMQPLINSKEKSRLNLVRLKPYYFQPLYKKIPIRSAEKMKFQPSNQDIVNHFTKKLSKNVGDKIYLDRIPCEWFAKVGNGQYSKEQRIYGFGKIKSDFFDIKSTFEPLKKLGFWKRFRNWIQRQVLKVLPRPNDVGTIRHMKPVMLGPVIGYLNYEIDLMRDIHLVAVCRFQDGKIIPTVTALSKSEILTYFQTKIQRNYLIVAGFLISTIVFTRWLWSDIKALLNTLKVKKQKLTSTYFNPEVDDDKICIICYVNCRNMIFFDCRHMIMCRECSQKYESDTCPYCKEEIDDVKIVSGIQ